MVQTQLKSLTLEEFLALPETKPASEYIDGQIIQKPMPQGKHSATQGELIISINTVLKPKKIARAFPELVYPIRLNFKPIEVFLYLTYHLKGCESGFSFT